MGQKAPPKHENGGRKRPHSNQREKVAMAESDIKTEKWWWNNVVALDFEYPDTKLIWW